MISPSLMGTPKSGVGATSGKTRLSISRQLFCSKAQPRAYIPPSAAGDPPRRATEGGLGGR
ncbi:MAG: hypothetical protein MZV63_15115 [Marinilabiliales bacterium]|nr:hypothetical protein [Marinilabiliales bacterium]